MAKAKKLTKKEMDEFKKILLELRSKIVGDLQHLEDDVLNKSQKDSTGELSGYGMHMADVATDNFDREFNLGLASNEQQILNDIDVALRKIEEGSYGLCEKYNTPIETPRLKALPYARYCLKAQQEQEKENRQNPS